MLKTHREVLPTTTTTLSVNKTNPIGLRTEVAKSRKKIVFCFWHGHSRAPGAWTPRTKRNTGLRKSSVIGYEINKPSMIRSSRLGVLVL